jgi:uncharacterized protein (DUF1015 family)
MDSGEAVTPPYLATPFHLEPFRAVMLAQHRVGGAGDARAFARPYREVVARMRGQEPGGRAGHDQEPALYLHEYTAGGITVRGLVGALDMSRRAADLASRAVFPHERIYPHRVRDLADRMLELRLNPAPILLVHRGPASARRVVRSLLDTPPDEQFTDHAQQRHRVWAIRGDALATTRAALATSRPLIADGHHRYAAYLQLQQAHPGTAWDRGLAMLVDQDDTPLFLGAIHRVLTRVTLSELVDAVARGPHHLLTCSRAAAVDALGPNSLAVTDGQTWASLRLALAGDLSAVEELHETMLPALERPPRSVTYHHSVEEATRKVRRGKDVAVLMPAPHFDLVHQIVAHDRLLPEKATSFQPKPSTGVLMRSIDDG